MTTNKYISIHQAAYRLDCGHSYKFPNKFLASLGYSIPSPCLRYNSRAGGEYYRPLPKNWLVI